MILPGEQLQCFFSVAGGRSIAGRCAGLARACFMASKSRRLMENAVAVWSGLRCFMLMARNIRQAIVFGLFFCSIVLPPQTVFGRAPSGFRGFSSVGLTEPYILFYGCDMKTTLDIPDTLLRQVKARAAMEGHAMKVFVVRALQTELRAPKTGAEDKQEPGWKSVFGAFRNRRKEIREIQSVIDREFSRVNPEDWK